MQPVEMLDDMYRQEVTVENLFRTMIIYGNVFSPSFKLTSKWRPVSEVTWLYINVWLAYVRKNIIIVWFDNGPEIVEISP